MGPLHVGRGRALKIKWRGATTIKCSVIRLLNLSHTRTRRVTWVHHCSDILGRSLRSVHSNLVTIWYHCYLSSYHQDTCHPYTTSAQQLLLYQSRVLEEPYLFWVSTTERIFDGVAMKAVYFTNQLPSGKTHWTPLWRPIHFHALAITNRRH